MTSARKIAANRQNARKSRGPRSAAGKSIASRNAVRHGLAAVVHRQPISETEIEGFAKALCGSDTNPILFEQARIIARNDLALQAITAQQIAVVERVRERSTIALRRRDNGVRFATRQMRQSRQAYDQASALREHLLEKYAAQLPPESELEEYQCDVDRLIPLHLETFLEERARELAAKPQDDSGSSSDHTSELVHERDETAALEEAAIDLIRLDRYERRAWSRQQRALRVFMN
jgi:hypothetical protein